MQLVNCQRFRDTTWNEIFLKHLSDRVETPGFIWIIEVEGARMCGNFSTNLLMHVTMSVVSIT